MQDEGYKYDVDECWHAWSQSRRFTVGRSGHGMVDQFRTRSAAEYAASMLNRGIGSINPHAVIGCRVELKA